MRKARGLGARVVEDFQRDRRYPLQNLVARLSNGIVMRPLIAKGIAEHKDADMRGVYRNLADRGLIA